MPDPASKLETERSALLQKLAATGDMRRGSITECFRRCGKPFCACVAPDRPGHGPHYSFATKVDGKTKTLQLRPDRCSRKWSARWKPTATSAPPVAS
jgi:hypothetical protein